MERVAPQKNERVAPQKNERVAPQKKERPMVRGRLSRSRKSHSNKYVKKQVPRKKKLSRSRSSGTYPQNPSDPLSALSLTELQFKARSNGIPFGGLNKAELKQKLAKYL